MEILIQRAPVTQRLEQPLAILRADLLVQRILLGRLGEKLCDLALVVGLDLAIALRLAAEALLAVHVGVVVDLDERLERHIQLLAIAQDAAVMIRQAPRTRIDVLVFIELALLGVAAEFRVFIPATQRPVATPRARVVLEHLHLVAGGAQLVGCHHAGDARTQHEHRGALRRALQVDRTGVGGVGREPQAAHGLVHGRVARGQTNHAQELAAAESGGIVGGCG